MLLNPEAQQYIDLGSRLGATIEQRLGVEMASLVHPDDLAAVAAVVWTGEVACRIRDIGSYVEEVANSYPPAVFLRAGIDRKDFIRRYPFLIGKNGDYSQGELAGALRNSHKVFTVKEAASLESYLATLFAYRAKLDPSIIQNPGVTMHAYGGKTSYVSEQSTLYTGDSPKVLLEYGPGIVGFSRFPQELRGIPIPISILVSKGIFVNVVLFTGSDLYGYSHDLRVPPAVITRRDGISSATTALLNVGFGGFVDTLIMSMVHSAGMEEILTGIKNGYTLLRRGGVMIVQHPYEVYDPNHAPGTETLTALKSQFGDTPGNILSLQDYKTIQQTTGRIGNAFKAVLVK